MRPKIFGLILIFLKIILRSKKESDNNILFLDILTTKTKAKFLTSVYRKPSFTGQYLHFQFFCTKKRKKKPNKNLVP